MPNFCPSFQVLARLEREQRCELLENAASNGLDRELARNGGAATVAEVLASRAPNGSDEALKKTLNNPSEDHVKMDVTDTYIRRKKEIEQLIRKGELRQCLREL